jgi:hypothetical protein
VGNRSRYVAVGSLVTAGLIARRRRRARLRAAAGGIVEAIEPSVEAETRRAYDLAWGEGEGHAGGHRHLDRPPSRWRRRGTAAHRPTGDRPYARD